MAKATINTGTSGDPVHTRTTGGTDESQAVVVGIDGSDSVVPADATKGLTVTESQPTGTTATTTHTTSGTINTSTAVVASNTARKRIRIRNISDTVVWLGIGRAAAADAGYPLYPNGDEFDGTTTAAINSLSTVASKKLAVVEET